MAAREVGEIVTANATYAFIRVGRRRDRDVFVHANDVIDPDLLPFEKGLRVEFEPGVDDQGRPRAKNVRGADGG